MAKLPMEREPQGQMTTEAPSVGLNPEAQAVGGKMIEQAGDAFSALGQKFDELRDHTETTKAETEAIYADNDNEVKAMQDPDVYGALDKAKERMAATNDTLAQKFSSPDARNAFMEKRQLQGATELVNLETKLRAKQINVAKATTFEHIDAQVKKFQDAVSPAERNQIASDIVGHVNKAIEKQYMTPEAGLEYLKAHLEEMHVGQVTHDMDLAEDPNNPNGKKMIDNITAELNKGKAGNYPTLTTKQRDELLSKARAMANKIAITDQKKQKVDNYMYVKSASELLSEGQLTNTWVAENAHHFTPTQLEHYSNAARKMPSTTDNPESVAECMKTLIDPDKSEQDYIEKMAELAGGGKLNPEENAMLYNLGALGKDRDPVFKTGVKAKIDQLIKAQKEQEAETNKNKDGWRGGWNAFWGITNGDTKETVGMVATAAKKVTPDNPVSNAVASTVKEKIKAENPTLEDTPHSTMSMKEGVRNVWHGNTNLKADYEIKNGEVVPKAKSSKKWQVGQVIEGTGKYAGKRYKVTDEKGNTEEVVNKPVMAYDEKDTQEESE